MLANGQTLAVALGAIAGDAHVVHLEDGVVPGIRMTNRTGLRGRNVIDRFAARDVDHE